MKNTHNSWAAAVLLFAAVIAGCGGGGGGDGGGNGGGQTVTGPSISQQPQSQMALVGAAVTFSVSAGGTAPLQYQWRRDGVDIAGATSQSLTLSGLTTNDSAGAFSVVVRNSGGSITSSNAILTVIELPAISQQPQSQTVLVGGSTTFSVVAAGTAPLQYQWRRDGANITGATAETLTLAGVTLNDSARVYSVVVGNGGGSTVSSNATLTVVALPIITQQPQNQTALVGASVTFTAAADGTVPMQYQWRRNGTDISGATSSSLTLTSLTLGDNGDSFSVVITNSGGSTTSSPALLTVNAPPQITQSPPSASVVVGSNVSFGVVAAGTAPLQYQWRRNGANIVGATSATLTLSGVTIEMDGSSITVAVSNIAGSELSAAAILTVTLPPVSSAVVPLTANDLVYDRSRNVIYASVPASNSIAIINPATGTVLSYIPAGFQPNVLALSHDNRYLYVGLGNDPQINRIDLAIQSVDLSIPLGNDFSGPKIARDIEAVPGSPRSIAVSLRRPNVTPSFGGVVVFDDATPRSATLSPGVSIGPIDFGASTGRLYGFDEQTSGSGFTRLNVALTGVNFVDTQLGLFNGIDADIEFDGGAVYSTTGAIIDPEARLLRGVFPFYGHFDPFAVYTTAAAVLPDVANQRVYFLSNVATSWQVQGFDSTRLIPIGLTTRSDGSSSAGSLIRCGADGLAFRTNNNVHILPIGSLQAPSPPPNPGPGTINLAVNNMVSDSARGLIYASVPGHVYTNGNSVAVIDPSIESVIRYIPVASEPNKLAISDDMRYLYVAHDGAGVIKRIDLTTFAVDQTIALNTIGRNLLVEDIDALPGNPNAFAIVRMNCCLFPNQSGIAIYDNGVKRVRETYGIGGLDESTVVAFGATSATLYGYSGRTNDYEFNRLSVDHLGVVSGDTLSGLIAGPVADFKYDGGLIYMQDVAIEPNARLLTRTFPLAQSSFSIAPDSLNNRVYYLSSPGAWQIEGFNATTAAPLGIAVIGDDAGFASNLLRWGANGLAFSTSNNRVYFRRTSDLQ